MNAKLVASLLIALAFVACRGSRGEGGGGEGEADFSCDRYCMARMRCLPAEYVDEDIAQCRNVCDVIRPEVGVYATECLEARSCEESDDACYSGAYDIIDRTEVADRFGVDCHIRRTECDGEFGDDMCNNAGLLRDEYIEVLAGCLDDPCADIDSCFDAVVD